MGIKNVLKRSDTAIPILQTNRVGTTFQTFVELVFIFFSPEQFHECFFKNVWEEICLFKILKSRTSVFEHQNRAEILIPRKI